MYENIQECMFHLEHSHALSLKITNDEVITVRTEETTRQVYSMPIVFSKTNWDYPEGFFLIIKSSLHQFPINDQNPGTINETYTR